MTAGIGQVLPRTARLIREGIDARLHRGMQIYVSQAGRVLVDDAVGESRDGVPLTSDTLLLWLSAGKPLTAVAVLRLMESGHLALNTHVADVIPEFAQAGKDAITVEQLLTHTAGLQAGVSGWPHESWEDIIGRICRTPLRAGWDARTRGAYDPARTWFVLGELVRRVDGRPIEIVVSNDIMRPIGMRDSWMSMPFDVHKRYGERIGRMYRAQGGDLVETQGHTAQMCAAVSPGASCRGPVRELGYFYEMLLNGGVRHGVRLLSEEAVALQTTRHRKGIYDETFRHRVDFGLGVIIDSNHHGPETIPYGFGRHCSPATFGHGGARTSIAFADPACRLVVAMVANGAQPEPIHNRRFRLLNTAIYEDLGLGP